MAASPARVSVLLFFFVAALHVVQPVLLRGPISANIANGRLSLKDAACGTVSILTDSNTRFTSNGLPLAPPNDVEVLVDGTNNCGGASLSAVTRLTVLPTHTVVVAPAQSGVVTRLNLGGPAHTDPAGLVWAAETGYTGGSVSTTKSAISGTSRPVLYQSERYGLTALSLAVPSKGAYALQLHFAEQYWNASGKRVFDIAAQGVTLVSGLDLYARVGKNAALVLKFPLNINSTRLDLTFVRKVDNPTISAIELLVAPATTVPATTKATTAAPTTKAPTTAAPTTKAPTAAPTTKAPTTASPTTKAPTAAPTTKPPTTTVPSEPTGTNMISVRTLTGATLTEKAEKLPAGKILTFPPNYNVADADMNRPSNFPVYCYFLRYPVGLIGSGVDQTVISIKPNSLTQAAAGMLINGKPYPRLENQPKFTGNDFYTLMRLDKASEVAHLTFKGTDQGLNPTTGKQYSYSGISLYGATPRNVHDVKIIGIPSAEGYPPEETFALYAYQVAGSFKVSDVVIDGLGNGGSAISWTTNDPLLDISYTRVSIKGIPNGGGCTAFNQKARSITITDFTVDGCLVGINFEQVDFTNGIKIIRPNITHARTSIGYSHLAIDSQAKSNRVDIYDPVGVDAAHPFGITISATYGFSVFVPVGPQKQRGADIHLWIKGVERPDLIKWMRTSGAP